MRLRYAISGERTLEMFYERLQPFANPFMALARRETSCPLAQRTPVSLRPLILAPVEALRMLFLARPDGSAGCEKEEKAGGLWDRQGRYWQVFDVDGTRQAARQRALPSTPDLPPAQRRLDKVCAPATHFSLVFPGNTPLWHFCGAVSLV